MTKLDKIVFLLAVLAIPVIFFLWDDIQNLFGRTASATSVDKEDGIRKEGKKKSKEEKQKGGDGAAGIRVSRKWEMPAALTEISGITYLDASRFACVQDELGKVFIYNLDSRTIEREIPFAGKGDYEDIALVGATAYVLRADGQLFELSDIRSAGQPSVLQYSTALTAEHDVEGLCYDSRNNRLLLAVKGKDPHSKDYKGVYAFDLATKKMGAAPVYRIGMTGTPSEDAGKRKDRKLQPSAIAVHPDSGDLYVIDGPGARLLVLDTAGNTKKLYQMNDSEFPQAEGIAFGHAGKLYISNEGKGGAGNLLQVIITP